MKTLSLKLLTLLLILGVAFTSCDNDNDDNLSIDDLEDVNIKIDDTQTFNMSKFIESFEQIFTFEDYFRFGNLEYTHSVLQGKAIESYLNMVSFGEFGDKVLLFVHAYDTNGVVISTELEVTSVFLAGKGEASINEVYKIGLNYQYDTNGYITKVNIVEGSSVTQELTIGYNALNQVTSIKYEQFSNSSKLSFQFMDKLNEMLGGKLSMVKPATADYIWTEYFERDAKGSVIKYSNSRMSEGDFVLFSYDTNSRMIQSVYYDGGVAEETINFVYNSANRLIEMNEEESDWKREFWYTNDTMSMVSFTVNNGISTYSQISDYAKGLIEIKYWYFRYDYDNNYAFDYCESREYAYDESNIYERYVTKREYFEGAPKSLLLLGYVMVDTWDTSNGYTKAKESIYDANDILLYYVEYVVSNGSIKSHQLYKADGTAIADDDISNGYQPWIHVLIYELDLSPS